MTGAQNKNGHIFCLRTSVHRPFPLQFPVSGRRTEPRCQSEEDERLKFNLTFSKGSKVVFFF